jgi:hypothetical protein
MNALQHAATSNLEVQQSQTALSKMLQGYQQNRSKTHDFSSQAPNYNFFPTVLYPTDAISSIFPAYARTLETIGDLCQTRLIFILGGIHIVQMTFNPIKLPLPTSVIFFKFLEDGTSTYLRSDFPSRCNSSSVCGFRTDPLDRDPVESPKARIFIHELSCIK